MDVSVSLQAAKATARVRKGRPSKMPGLRLVSSSAVHRVRMLKSSRIPFVRRNVGNVVRKGTMPMSAPNGDGNERCGSHKLICAACHSILYLIRRRKLQSCRQPV